MEIVEESNIVFVDEVGFNISTRAQQDISLNITWGCILVPNTIIKKISVCCTINKNDVIY
jgi:hypothetical protein